MVTKAVRYKVKKEQWNECELKNGSILRIKFVLINVITTGDKDERGNTLYNFNGQDIVGIIPSEKDIGEPSKREYSKMELEKSIIGDDLEFKSLTDNWNEYELEDGTQLKIKLVMVKVSKTDKFDKVGVPIYLVSTQPLAKGKPPKKGITLIKPPT